MKQQGKQNFMTPQRMTLLEEIGFEWSVQQATIKQRTENQQEEATHKESTPKIDTSDGEEKQVEVLQKTCSAKNDLAIPLLPPQQVYTEQQQRSPNPPLQGGYVDQQPNQRYVAPVEYPTVEIAALGGYAGQWTAHQGYANQTTSTQQHGVYPADPNANQSCLAPPSLKENYGSQTFSNDSYQL
uniref:Helicase-associated domain-containing protein n=1 Tax=Ditylum brightwellii TaxID=49249 RepID=A0A6S8TMA6_9STRA|mmetsp:Transcript_15037/g.19941  ORF Transcript_15037/g.19941 Transcript_15037/m.19941 type:complete len:184 (-) Transcript_15037:595-1146(-)